MEELKKVFDEYVEKFEQTSKVKLKYEHTLRVANNCFKIAEFLNLSEMDKKIAYLMGLSHDLGRFKQLALTDSFSDNKTNIDHASLSVDILFKEGLINKFMDTMDYDDIIKYAILSHNKDSIDKNLGERTKMFASILRDADKLDILNILTFEKKENIFWFNEYHALEINDKVLNDHLNGKLIDYNDIDTNFDLAIAYYNYALDINYKWTKEEILKNKYYEKITERFKTWFLKDHILETIEKKSLEYLKKDNY
ncbi:MAG: HD domain-containing protein [Bacilli bacterium]|nr:HD domain-containing protein [Bacilli bacterium]